MESQSACRVIDVANYSDSCIISHAASTLTIEVYGHQSCRFCMKNIDPRLADTSVTDSCGNIFIDLGFDAAEAQVMALRVELMVQLREQINKTGLTQAQAARQLGGYAATHFGPAQGCLERF